MIPSLNLVEHMQKFDFDDLPEKDWEQLIQEGARRFIKQHELDAQEDQIVFYYLEMTA